MGDLFISLQQNATSNALTLYRAKNSTWQKTLFTLHPQLVSIRRTVSLSPSCQLMNNKVPLHLHQLPDSLLSFHENATDVIILGGPSHLSLMRFCPLQDLILWQYSLFIQTLHGLPLSYHHIWASPILPNPPLFLHSSNTASFTMLPAFHSSLVPVFMDG